MVLAQRMSVSHPQSVRQGETSIRAPNYGSRVVGQKWIERVMSDFLRRPASVRNAARVIIIATALVVVASGFLMRLVDRSEYPNVWRGIWWAMQTITTVGYGDVTPARTSGRIVAIAVMLWGIAFLTVVIAAITSTFITRAARDRGVAVPGGDVPGGQPADTALDARLADLAARLERVERALDRLADR